MTHDLFRTGIRSYHCKLLKILEDPGSIMHPTPGNSHRYLCSSPSLLVRNCVGAGCEYLSVCVCVGGVCVCLCLCLSERKCGCESVFECMLVWVRECQNERVCVCVCMCVFVREFECHSVCICVCLSEKMWVWMWMWECECVCVSRRSKINKIIYLVCCVVLYDVV